MKVLLTGASGFVGSHVLDSLRARGLPAAILLRPTSDQRFIQPLGPVEVRNGSIEDVGSLRAAMSGITHVIHCAGLTKARTGSEFLAVNQMGARNVVQAANAQAGAVKRLVHISSLAAIGPAGRDRPAREDDPPQPVSTYGQSKLAGELEVRGQCRSEFVIVRPPAVYGPRDNAFLSLFQAVNRHLLPRPSATQALSLVFVRDLAQAIVTCLEHPAAAGRAYFVAGRQVVTGRELAKEIAAQIPHWTIPVPLPAMVFWPVCVFNELWSRLTHKASLLNLQKYAELRAPGWVCDPSRLAAETGYECMTVLKAGVAETLAWYRKSEWL